MLENKQVGRSFFSVLFMPYNKSFIDQASSVKMAAWVLASFSFYVFMDLDFVPVYKNAKRELGQYPAILTLRLVNNISFSKNNNIYFFCPMCNLNRD